MMEGFLAAVMVCFGIVIGLMFILGGIYASLMLLPLLIGGALYSVLPPTLGSVVLVLAAVAEFAWLIKMEA